MNYGVLNILAPESQSGAFNMALDEALLETCRAGNAPTLRLYDWSPPTISLGRFQYLSEDESAALGAFCRAKGFDLVRRSTGGGAILHHREITYSLVCPLGHAFLTAGREALYRGVHRAWIATLAAEFPAAPPLVLVADAHDGAALNGEALLCFARRTAFDVVAANESAHAENHHAVGAKMTGAGDFGSFRKVIGSAQRRSKTALLQHGSVKIWPSHEGSWTLPIAPAEKRSFSELATDVLPTFVKALGFEGFPKQLEAEVLAQAAEISALKYAQPDWTERAKVHRP